MYGGLLVNQNVHIYIYIYTRVFIHLFIYLYTPVCMCVYRIYTYIYMSIYMYMYIIYIYIYSYMCVLLGGYSSNFNFVQLSISAWSVKSCGSADACQSVRHGTLLENQERHAAAMNDQNHLVLSGISRAQRLGHSLKCRGLCVVLAPLFQAPFQPRVSKQKGTYNNRAPNSRGLMQTAPSAGLSCSSLSVRQPGATGKPKILFLAASRSAGLWAYLEL